MKTIARGVAFLSLALCACDQGTVSPHSIGRFEYHAYDSLGVHVAKGWILISADDSSSLSGSWHIEAVANPADIGPQIGDGRLIGTIAGDRLLIDLTPNYRDNNVGLSGRFDGTTLEGSWTFIGFAGVINSGPFTAVRKTD